MAAGGTAAGGRRAAAARWAILALAAGAVAAVGAWVDLTPRVEGDFFFASDAPELRASERIDALFPSSPQVLLAAVPGGPRTVGSPGYVERVGGLTELLGALPGVSAVTSLTSGPPSPEAALAGPFWSRLLAPADTAPEAGGDGAPAPRLSYLVVGLREPVAEEVIGAIEEAVESAETGAAEAGTGSGGDGFRVALSGVPFVVERIRRALLRDLGVFTGAALAVFGLTVALLYRDRWVVAGVLATCLTACAATLAILSAAGAAIGVLTANIVTIVFVLTLSHLVYLTANHQRLGETVPAVRLTAEASFWCMATTLAGFVSLLLASAEPLRELGRAGAVGTVVAFAAAYLLYPPFLRRGTATDETALRRDVVVSGSEAGEGRSEQSDPFGGRALGPVVAAVAVLAAVAALGLPRITTDPGLLAYFDRGSEIRRGLEVIDASGGSSPLRVLFEDAGGARLDTDGAIARLRRVQEEVEADPAVGTALSLAPLVDEASRAPMGAFLGTRQLVDALASPASGGVADSFVTPDRDRGLLFLRMREAGRDEPRRAAVARVEAALREEGFEPVVSAGLYELQGQLADLVAASLVTGLGGLAVLFVGVSWFVARSLRSAAAMMACLAGTPLFLFGGLGLAGMPVDFISSPAANVALAMGIDSMIHLVSARRRLRRKGLAPWEAWVAARSRMARPVAGAAAILAAGFGLFLLSSFPPTRRFGVAVVIGLAAATVLTLVALPWLASLGRRRGPR